MLRNNLGNWRRLGGLLSVLLLAIAIVAFVTAVPTNWFRSAKVTGTILSLPAHIWIVDDDGPAHFRKIQDAINAANPRDTIYVHNGTYYEHVVVNKTISLIGENREATIIEGNGTEDVVLVIAENVIISSFTIQNQRTAHGIHLQYANNSLVENTLISNTQNGIWLEHSINTTIRGNNVSGNANQGILLYYASNNTVIGNTVEYSGYSNLNVYSSYNNTIKSNILRHNWLALIIHYGSSQNKILQNTFDGQYAIFSSDNNKFYHNNFYRGLASPTAGLNIWDDGYPSGGNYWSDYVGVDVKCGSGQDLLGSDSIGDTPYIIDERNQDRYPLMKPWSPRVASIITLSAEPPTVTVGSDVTLSGGIIPVRANVNVTIYQRLVGEGIWNTLTTLKTNSTGGYTYVWKPTQIATHELKVIWLGDEITLPAESIIANVKVEPIHDIALVDVVPSATEVYVGWAVSITVVVRNKGNVTETFTVTYKYELEGIEHPIGTATVTNLLPSATATLTFTWTTTDITVHTIKAEIPPLPAETDTADNIMTSLFTVKVKMLGDINGDNTIDMKDVALAAQAFGENPERPRWNPQADINGDQEVDMRDIAVIAKNFGKTYP